MMGRFNRASSFMGAVKTECKLDTGQVVAYDLAYDKPLELGPLSQWQYLGTGKHLSNGEETGPVKHLYRRL